MNLKKLICASGLLATAMTTQAADIYVDTSAFPDFAAAQAANGAGVAYDAPFSVGDLGDFITDTFTEFGFTGTRATSVYDFSDGSIFGDFYDSNIPADLLDAGIPAGGFAEGVALTLAGTPLGNPANGEDDSIVIPTPASAETNIDGLNPLVPPLGSDNEGFLTGWELDTEFFLEGTLTPAGPSYTGGFIRLYLEDNISNTRTLALEATVDSSSIELANLLIDFEITSALPGAFFVDNGTGSFLDLSAALGKFSLRLDTNVDPPIPAPDQLVATTTIAATPFGAAGTDVAVRQSLLDGSLELNIIPEPGTLAVMSLGLIGLGVAGRRRRK